MRERHLDHHYGNDIRMNRKINPVVGVTRVVGTARGVIPHDVRMLGRKHDLYPGHNRHILNPIGRDHDCDIGDPSLAPDHFCEKNRRDGDVVGVAGNYCTRPSVTSAELLTLGAVMCGMLGTA